jgi:hypothetical protein
MLRCSSPATLPGFFVPRFEVDPAGLDRVMPLVHNALCATHDKAFWAIFRFAVGGVAVNLAPPCCLLTSYGTHFGALA